MPTSVPTAFDEDHLIRLVYRFDGYDEPASTPSVGPAMNMGSPLPGPLFGKAAA